MWWSYLLPLSLAYILTLEITALSTIIAIWTWITIAIHVIAIPFFFTRGRLPAQFLTSKNRKIATEVRLYHYVIGYLCSAALYYTMYEYYPMTATTGFIVNTVFLASFTHLMEQIRDAIKLGR